MEVGLVPQFAELTEPVALSALVGEPCFLCGDLDQFPVDEAKGLIDPVPETL